MDVMRMSIAGKRARTVKVTNPSTLTAFRALPAERRRRVRALVYRRGYTLEKAMDIPGIWLESHILYGYSYRRPWHPLKSFIVVVVTVFIVFAVFSVFWRL